MSHLPNIFIIDFIWLFKNGVTSFITTNICHVGLIIKILVRLLLNLVEINLANSIPMLTSSKCFVVNFLQSNTHIHWLLFSESTPS